MKMHVPEDDKLIVFARGALARAETTSGATVRRRRPDPAGAPVATSALTLTALQVAAATALSSGAAVVRGRRDRRRCGRRSGLTSSPRSVARTLITDLKGAVVSKVVAR